MPFALGPGLKPIMESIDNRQDFKVYMQNYAIATNRPTGPRREGPWEEGFVSFPAHEFIKGTYWMAMSSLLQRPHLYLVTISPIPMLGYLIQRLGDPWLLTAELTARLQMVVRRTALARRRPIHRLLQKPCNSILIVVAQRSEFLLRSR